MPDDPTIDQPAKFKRRCGICSAKGWLTSFHVAFPKGKRFVGLAAERVVYMCLRCNGTGMEEIRDEVLR